MKKYTIPRVIQAKGQEPLLCVTGYDAFSARVLEQSPVHMILVGDSLGHVIQGGDSTLPVTLDEMIYHSRIVARHAPHKLVIADMPFGSFGVSPESTVDNCVKVFKASGVGAVKMEGASRPILEAIPLLAEIGVPVMGHLGFRPQSVHVYGGYKIDGKTEAESERLVREAQALAQAGAFAIVLECVIAEVARQVTAAIPIPTIGIGSGREVDGQVLVFHDLLGMTFGKVPSFVRAYAQVAQISQTAIATWAKDVQKGEYPADQETYQIKA